MLKNPFANAVGAALYIAVVVYIVSTVGKFVGEREILFAPVIFLGLLVLSVALMGVFFFYTPASLFLAGKNREALVFFGKTIATFAGILLLLGIVILVLAPKEKAYNEADMTPRTKTTYVDQVSGAFSFEYDPKLEISAGEIGDMQYGSGWSSQGKGLGLELVDVRLPRSLTSDSGTNLSEAYLTVGRSSDAEGITNCTAPGENEQGAGAGTIGGYPFSKFEANDAGAGNFYEVTSYRGIVDGDCYAIEYTIHSTNISNYPPERGIREFDKAKVQSEFENIIRSFKFLVNSD